MKILIYRIMMIMLSTQLSTTTLFAAKTRSAEPVTFSSKTMALTIAPDASVILSRDGKVVSDPKSPGWSIYCWTDCPKDVRNGGTRTQLDNMAKIGPNELLLWSSEKHFEVKVAITPKDRYFTFELLHVSNDAKTGGLNRDWQGHRVECYLTTIRQQDGWKLNKLKLNPMTEFYLRTDNLAFTWPYAQLSQTDDRPQPQGAIAFYGFVGDEEHDDILTDIWVGEPSLPRPNRAKLTSWTRSDVKAWLDRWVKEHEKPWRTISFATHGKPENLYKMADIAEQTGINRIYLHHYEWQGDSVGLPSAALFPNGMSDVDKWVEYCRARGVSIKLHGFGGLYRSGDIKYDQNVHPDGLVKSGRGTLVNDVENGQAPFLVKPDLSLYPWLKPGMPPYSGSVPWGPSSASNGSYFPPYSIKNCSIVKINNKTYSYSHKITKDNLWEITLSNGAVGSKDLEFKAGDLVEFIVHGTNTWLVPDPRSKMYEEIAEDYANVLNHFQSYDLYDGGGMCGSFGYWSLDKMTQMVFEGLDHPSADQHNFGHFDQRFKRIEKLRSGRSNMAITPWDHAKLAGSLDDISFNLNKSVDSKDITIRGNHRGLYIEDMEIYGGWDKALEILNLWSELKPYMSEDHKKLMVWKKAHGMAGRYSIHDDFFVASETDTQWNLTKTRAMRREGLDLAWQKIPERPMVSPRQFFKADGKALEGLHNPYGTQTPDIELHVMATMKQDGETNVSMMPKNANDIDFTNTSSQGAYGFRDGALTLSIDNSKSQNEYEFSPVHLNRAKESSVASWLYSSIGTSSVFDMTRHRGFAITVEGDGSGSLLYVRAGSHWGRTFVIENDFVGQRTFEIPNGEASINRYGFVGAITAFRYNKMDKLFAFINNVPAGKKAKIKILDIQAMYENHDLGLIDPVLTLNNKSAQVTGSIPYNHYLTYTEGPVAKVYGPNWHFVKDVAVTVEGNFEAVNGNNTFSVASAKSPDAWLSCRIKVQDSENRIIISKPKGGEKPVKTAIK